MREPESILVIRRDNIGDLVCTTPLLSALRMRFARASIEVLANSYNAPVLEGNPDVDRVHTYRKLKHLGSDGGAIGALGARAAMLWNLRRTKFDLIVIASGTRDSRAVKLAGFLDARRVVCADSAVPGQHEVERTFTAARQLGIQGTIPPLRVMADPDFARRIREELGHATVDPTRKIIGFHISARRPMQRWPAEHFAELANALHERHRATILLFWSPGAEDHAQHPGDDAKAGKLQKLVSGSVRLMPRPTAVLRDLIGGLSACDALVCSDGGAMHIAAGLGKPIVCFFGDSDVARWRPWGTRHILLTAASRRAADITVRETSAAASALVGT